MMSASPSAPGQGSSLAAWRRATGASRAGGGGEINITILEEEEAAAPVDLVDGSGAAEEDLIMGRLPGEPEHSPDFKQYAGFVTVDRKRGRSLFYYLVEAEEDPASKPLLLWLNGGPGCSSLLGAMVENGPFGVNPDGKSLYKRHYAWNKAVNMLFLESPAGVGFSYSNTSSDYSHAGDKRTALDSYAFLVNWLQRFPHYKTRDFYIAGESYAGHYIPQLADVILKRNKKPSKNIPVIRLQGVMVGNGLMNLGTDTRGDVDFVWSHALISDEAYEHAVRNCSAKSCDTGYLEYDIATVNPYYIYGPSCDEFNSTRNLKWRRAAGNEYDPCEMQYLYAYLNLPRVQEALHVNLPVHWNVCNPNTVLPVYRSLMSSGLRILIYSGDADSVVSVTATRYSINELGLKVLKPWFPWFDESEQVAGYRVVYNGLTFATVLGAGHEVPWIQPSKAFALLNLFLRDGL
ncbi:hypothetical protein C2S52_002070 [Perilla frutescens var. hirtella]|nr:hypothetical protein C2S52_002070 [Perilla frutescens var. hirtella]